MKTIKISSIQTNKDNPRVIRDGKFKSLVESIKRDSEFLEKRGIVHADGVILGGNQRFRAIKEALQDDEFRSSLGLAKGEIPASWVQDASLWSEEKRKRFVIVDNGSWGEWDFDLLANIWGDLPLIDLGMDLPKEWLSGNKAENEKEEDLLSKEDEDIKNLGSVYDLKHDIKFDGIGLYDFPEIKADMILNIDELSTWAGPNATYTNPPYLYNYGTDSTINLPWDKTVVSFYTEDARFERLWENTAEVVKRLLNKKILGCITPNYSTYFHYPKALRIYNIFRSRWVGRYMQEAGVRIIPDITCGLGDLDCVIDGIPKESIIALQAHRKYTNIEKEEKNKIIIHCLKSLQPSRVLVYAPDDRREMFPVLNDFNAYFLTPRTILHGEHKKKKEVIINA